MTTSNDRLRDIATHHTDGTEEREMAAELLVARAEVERLRAELATLAATKQRLLDAANGWKADCLRAPAERGEMRHALNAAQLDRDAAADRANDAHECGTCTGSGKIDQRLFAYCDSGVVDCPDCDGVGEYRLGIAGLGDECRKLRARNVELERDMIEVIGLRAYRDRTEAAIALYERDCDADLLVWTIKGPRNPARDAKGSVHG